MAAHRKSVDLEFLDTRVTGGRLVIGSQATEVEEGRAMRDPIANMHEFPRVRRAPLPETYRFRP